jgi:hypothetical protein
MTPAETPQTPQTAKVPRVEELRELELTWSVPSLTLWSGQLSGSD